MAATLHCIPWMWLSLRYWLGLSDRHRALRAKAKSVSAEALLMIIRFSGSIKTIFWRAHQGVANARLRKEKRSNSSIWTCSGIPQSSRKQQGPAKKTQVCSSVGHATNSLSGHATNIMPMQETAVKTATPAAAKNKEKPTSIEIDTTHDAITALPSPL